MDLGPRAHTFMALRPGVNISPARSRTAKSHGECFIGRKIFTTIEKHEASKERKAFSMRNGTFRNCNEKTIAKKGISWKKSNSSISVSMHIGKLNLTDNTTLSRVWRVNRRNNIFTETKKKYGTNPCKDEHKTTSTTKENRESDNDITKHAKVTVGTPTLERRISSNSDISSTSYDSRSEAQSDSKDIQRRFPPSQLLRSRSIISTIWTKHKRRRAIHDFNAAEPENKEKRKNKSRHRTKSDLNTIKDDEPTESPEERRHRLRRLFWRTLQLVRALSTMFYNLKRSTMDSTEQAHNSDLYYYAAHESADDDTPSSFDKRKYSRKCMLRLPTWAQVVASKPANNRTEEDLRKLHSLMKTMKSFQEKFTDKMQRNICQVATYTYCEKGRVVLRQGHPAQNFYFIYSGSVFVQFESQDFKTGTAVTKTSTVIGQGQSFGELAFLSDGLRTASIICCEATELFQIDKPTFMEFCPDIFSKELLEKIRIARKHILFRDWPQEHIQKLCFESQLQDIPHGKLIERNWSTTQHIYVLEKGTVLLLKEFSFHDAIKQAKDTFQNISFLKQDKVTDNPCFSTVGELIPGECNDPGILADQHNLEPVIMISQGVTLLRISTKLLQKVAPPFVIDQYLRKHYIPRCIPLKRKLLDKYVSELVWSEYRKQVVRTARGEKRGDLLASVPATKKGSSGWAKWPGSICSGSTNIEKDNDLHKILLLEDHRIKSRLFMPKRNESTKKPCSKDEVSDLPSRHSACDSVKNNPTKLQIHSPPSNREMLSLNLQN